MRLDLFPEITFVLDDAGDDRERRYRAVLQHLHQHGAAAVDVHDIDLRRVSVADLRDDQTVVEILASAEHKHDFVAQEDHQDVLAAVDLAVEKLEGQLRRYKEKIQDHRRTPSVGDVAGGRPDTATEE